MRPTYLTGERVYLRGMVDDDKAHTVAWYPSTFPVNAPFGEQQLTELHGKIWGASMYQLAIVNTADDRLVGGARVSFAQRDRKAKVEIHMAPWVDDADVLRAEALRVLVPWLLEDHNLRRVDAHLESNQPASIAAAEELGMFEAVRLREFWRRPGGRVDAVIYQIFNPHEEQRHA